MSVDTEHTCSHHCPACMEDAYDRGRDSIVSLLYHLKNFQLDPLVRRCASALEEAEKALAVVQASIDKRDGGEP